MLKSGKSNTKCCTNSCFTEPNTPGKVHFIYILLTANTDVNPYVCVCVCEQHAWEKKTLNHESHGGNTGGAERMDTGGEVKGPLSGVCVCVSACCVRHNSIRVFSVCVVKRAGDIN